jgi:exodeoxyribonuclease VII large subunit
MQPDGVGALWIAYEQLRRKLEAEGLFDAARKRPLPQYPETVGVITSPTGAAVRDIMHILGRRYPAARVLLYPALVQGAGAAPSLVAGMRYFNENLPVDVIIIGRGGGSAEDLWAFNDEGLARAVANSHIPVISAVGHEPDVTIADYVADVRASTPSNGAEIAVPDQNDMRGRIEHLTHRLSAAQRTRLTGARKDFQRLQGNRMLQDMRAPIDDRRMKLDSIQRDLSAALEQKIKQGRMKLTGLSSGLHAMSPLKVLGRGYAVARNEAGVISSVTQTQPGENIRIMLSDGELNCQVDHKEERTWQ